jgi:hypothetical protein
MWDYTYTSLSRTYLLFGAGVHLENMGPGNVLSWGRIFRKRRGVVLLLQLFFSVCCVSLTYFFSTITIRRGIITCVVGNCFRV